MNRVSPYSEVFRERRLELGLSLRQVCEGICTPSSLFRVESGQITPNYDRARALMERLDLPDNEYWAMLSSQELNMEALRGEIVLLGERFFREKGAARRKLREEALPKLRELEALIGRGNHIARQFAAAHRILFTEPKGEREWLERGEALTEILRMTLPRFQPGDMSGMLCSYFDLELIAHIIIAFVRGGALEKVSGTAGQLDAYTAAHFQDRPVALASIGILPFVPLTIALERKNWAEALAIADTARRVPLQGRSRICTLPEVVTLTEVMARCRLEMGDQEAAGALSAQAQELRLALSGGDGLPLAVDFRCSSAGMRNGNLYVFGNYIKSRRQCKGLTQAEIFGGICDSTTYSRLETGRQTPSNYVAEAILKRLGEVPHRFCFVFLDNVWTTIQQLGVEHRGRFYVLRDHEMRRLLDTYRPVLPELDTELKKWPARYYSPYVYGLKIAISGEPPQRQLELLLERLRTDLPDFDLGDICACCFYSFAELEIIEKIAYLCRDLGDRARFLSIVRQLARRLRDFCGIGANDIQMEPELAVMYSDLMAELEDWEEAVRIAELGRRASIANHRPQNLCCHLEVLGRCWAGFGGRERSQSFYRQAHALCLAFGWEERAQDIASKIQ